MKKILFLAILSIFTLVAYSQDNDPDIKSILNQIKKSDADINNPKKNVNPATWEKRAEIFINALGVNSKYLVQGMEANSIPLLGISDNNPTPFYGKAQKTYEEGKFTVFEYPKIKIYIDRTNNFIIDHWVDLYVIDSSALNKAYDALIKTKDLDADQKVLNKKATKETVAKARELFMNRSIEKYNDSNFVGALEDLEKSITLYNFPRMENDTMPIAAYYYYAGVFAFNAKQEQKAYDYFSKSADANYEVGTSYQYLAQILYNQNDSSKAEVMLQNAAKKYPNEVTIIYLLIDFYTPRGEYDKAFEYIDKAIAMKSDNAQLYFVKGNAYEKVYYKKEANYYHILVEADSLDKLAFQFRSDATKSKTYTDQENNILNNLAPAAETDANTYAQKSLDAYNEALKFSPNNVDYFYQIAYFYYQRANNAKTNSSNLRKIKPTIDKLDALSSTYLNTSRENAEKAYSINPKDVFTLRLLKNIYYRLNMTDQYTKISDELKNLK